MSWWVGTFGSARGWGGILRPAVLALPMKPATTSTAGSVFTISTYLTSFLLIDLNEIFSGPRAFPVMRPVSCCGEETFGTKEDKENPKHTTPRLIPNVIS